MAKRPGSKSSRSERRAGKQRAERAREHGLPERREAVRRARASTPAPSSSGDVRSTDVSGRSPKKPGIPTLVKVVAGALVILLGAYILGQRRQQALTDTTPAPELPSGQASASADSQATAAARPEPAFEPEPAPRASAAPGAPVEPAAVVSVTSPAKPVVAMPLVSAPALPKVPRPVVAPAAAVTVTKPPAPAAPRAPAPAAPTKPVENPY